jgi:pimeloyl-ACP methyl ester carboxylesterase
VQQGHSATRFITPSAFPRSTMAEAAADLLALLPSTQRFAACGLSMGGYVALAAAAQQPERFSGLALLNTQCRADSAEVKARRAAQVAAVTASGSLSSVLAAQTGLLLHPRCQPPSASEAVRSIAAGAAGGGAAAAAAAAAAASAYHPALLAYLTGALQCGPAAFVQQQQCLVSRGDTCGTLASLARLRTPMLALTGTHDALTPPAVARAMWQLMGSSGGQGPVLLPECGHLSALEQPEALAGALAEWLGRVDAAEEHRGA